MHDGSGIRTTVFLKGCPLRCLWCSNPESQLKKPEILYDRRLCLKCGACIEACPNDALSFGPSGFIEFDYKKCCKCFNCVNACISRAIKVVGKLYSVKDVIKELQKDTIFFRRSQGGITLGGGEPLYQQPMALELLRACRELNLHTTVETCGHVPWESLYSVIPYVNNFYYDIKHIDPVQHRRLVGADNTIILQNLKNLSKLAKNLVVRYPLIPGLNNSPKDMESLSLWMVKNCPDLHLELMPYHRYGVFKYEMLGRKYPLKDVREPTKDQIDSALNILHSHGISSQVLLQ